MSEGIIFPGDRVPWEEETIDFDLSDEMLAFLALKSLEDGMNVEDEILHILQKQIRKDGLLSSVRVENEQ